MSQVIENNLHRLQPSLWKLAIALSLGIALSACGGKPADESAKDGKEDAAEATAKTDENTDEDGKKKEPQAVPVEVVQVSRRDIEASYTGTAALQAPQEAQVVAKTSGILLKLEAEEGDTVKAGQVLARIDPERTRLEVQRAEAMLRKLEADFARSTELFARKLVATDQHERLRFDVATQRAAWDIAKLELSYTNIVAPISGVIAERMAKEGNLIPLNAPVFRVVGNERLEAVLNVPERELATVRTGLPVAMAVDALPGQTFRGVIDRVSPVIDAATGTFRATAAFVEHGNRLMPGMFGRIAVVYEQRTGSLAIPRVALLEDEGEPAVFVVTDEKVARRSLVLGHVNGEYAEVKEGLTEGEQVVTAGKVAVRDGSKVQVISPASSAAAPQTAAALAGTPQG